MPADVGRAVGGLGCRLDGWGGSIVTGAGKVTVTVTVTVGLFFVQKTTSKPRRNTHRHSALVTFR
jgi:hypothetical protein